MATITLNRSEVKTPAVKRGISSRKGIKRGAINVPGRATVYPSSLKIEDAAIRALIEGKYVTLGQYGDGKNKKFAIYVIPEKAVEYEMFHRQLKHNKEQEKLPVEERTEFTLAVRRKNNLGKGAEYFEYDRPLTKIGKHIVSKVTNGLIKFKASDKEAPTVTDTVIGKDENGKDVFAVEAGWAGALGATFNHDIFSKDGERLKLSIVTRRDTLNFKTTERNPKFTDDKGEWLTKTQMVFTSATDEAGNRLREEQEIPTVRYLNTDLKCDVIVLDGIYSDEAKTVSTLSKELKAAKTSTNAKNAAKKIFNTDKVKNETVEVVDNAADSVF